MDKPPVFTGTADKKFTKRQVEWFWDQDAKVQRNARRIAKWVPPLKKNNEQFDAIMTDYEKEYRRLGFSDRPLNLLDKKQRNKLLAMNLRQLYLLQKQMKPLRTAYKYASRMSDAKEKMTLMFDQNRKSMNKMIRNCGELLPLWVGRPGEYPPERCGRIPTKDKPKRGELAPAYVNEMWILAEVMAVEDETDTLVVRDIDEDGGMFRVYTEQVIPLPKWRLDPLRYPDAIYPVDAVVYGLYPQTTCFYKGIVSNPPLKDTDDYFVTFEDEEYDGLFAPEVPVPQRFIVAFKPVPKKIMCETVTELEKNEIDEEFKIDMVTSQEDIMGGCSATKQRLAFLLKPTKVEEKQVKEPELIVLSSSDEEEAASEQEEEPEADVTMEAEPGVIPKEKPTNVGDASDVNMETEPEREPSPAQKIKSPEGRSTVSEAHESPSTTAPQKRSSEDSDIEFLYEVQGQPVASIPPVSSQAPILYQSADELRVDSPSRFEPQQDELLVCNLRRQRVYDDIVAAFTENSSVETEKVIRAIDRINFKTKRKPQVAVGGGTSESDKHIPVNVTGEAKKKERGKDSTADGREQESDHGPHESTEHDKEPSSKEPCATQAKVGDDRSREGLAASKTDEPQDVEMEADTGDLTVASSSTSQAPLLREEAVSSQLHSRSPSAMSVSYGSERRDIDNTDIDEGDNQDESENEENYEDDDEFEDEESERDDESVKDYDPNSSESSTDVPSDGESDDSIPEVPIDPYDTDEVHELSNRPTRIRHKQSEKKAQPQVKKPTALPVRSRRKSRHSETPEPQQSSESEFSRSPTPSILSSDTDNPTGDGEFTGDESDLLRSPTPEARSSKEHTPTSQASKEKTPTIQVAETTDPSRPTQPEYSYILDPPPPPPLLLRVHQQSSSSDESMPPLLQRGIPEDDDVVMEEDPTHQSRPSAHSNDQ